MAKKDLSAALSLVMQKPDIKYSNIGNIVTELTRMGFDQKTAKMAVMMAFQEGPEVTYLKSAGVSAQQAAKSMFEANLDLGVILDNLLEMGYTKEESSDAVDMIDTDEGRQTVTDHTDTDGSEDNAFAGVDDPGYEYDDIPAEAIKKIIETAEQNKDEVTPEFIRTVLDEYSDVSPQSADQLIQELTGRTSSTKVSIVEQSWRELGLMLQKEGVPPDQIINNLKSQGASDEEAQAAALPLEGGPASDNMGEPGMEGPFGAESDNPEDLEMGPGEDFPYGAGMDTEGPGGLNDSLEGAPGPNDFSATGGGYMEAPSDTEDGDFFNEGQDSGQAPDEEGSTNDGYWASQGEDYVSNDPQMTKTDLTQILKNEGASDEEAKKVTDRLGLEDDPAINPGTIVRAGGNVGEVTGVWDTLYGKMASVRMESGSEYEFAVEDVAPVEQDKLATTRDEIFDKVAAHLSGDWYDGLNTLPSNYRDTYSDRMNKARALQSEVNGRLATTKDIGEMGLLGEARSALANEIAFCQTRLASADFVGEEEYVNSLPKYEFAKEASLGYGFGPGGGESMVLIAEEMEKEAAAIDWNELSRTASVEFVGDLSPILIGDGQEVARLASAFISEKVAALPVEKALEVANDFLANVEKVRRSMVIQMRTAGEEEPEKKDDCPNCDRAEVGTHCPTCGWDKKDPANHAAKPNGNEYYGSTKDENLFEVIEELDDLQDEVEEDEEDKKKEKKSSSEDMWDQDKWRVANIKNDKISDEGWLV
jgi:Holliday junction resolvasome RuvABC DNA-binding subunit